MTCNVLAYLSYKMNKNNLESTIKVALYYKSLGDKTFGQLSEDDIHWQPNEDSNSIAVIVKHIRGNMLSRWANFLTEDGEKTWRKRDEEFENTIKDKADLIKLWNEGWDCFLDALYGLTPSDLEKVVYIRNEGHTVYEAITRQMAHYPYHIGQIVYVAKILKSAQWKSISIPKNKSSTYNKEKFNKEKRIKHFTDNI